MKKLVLGAAITAALFGGAAHAAVPVIDPATTTVMYLSGASASLDYINNLITGSAAPAADRFCATTAEVWRFNDNGDGKTQNAFYCTKNASNTALSSAKSHILIYKRSEGGSDLGVAPVIANTAIPFLNVAAANCAQTTAPVIGTSAGAAKCTYDATTTNATQYTLAIPDLGMSDVDPGQFRGNNVTAGFAPVSATDLAAIKVSAVSAVVFGEPVTLQLYKALQTAQKATGKIPSTCAVGDRTESCMPSLNSAEIASLHTGNWIDWNGLKVTVGATTSGLYDYISANAPTLLPAANVVHVCRRVDGSGTQAQHGIVFLNAPCSSAADATNPAHDLGTLETDPYTQVHEMSTSGGVSDCLKSLDTGVQITASSFDETAFAGGSRWAVGLQSLEKGNASNYEFVKIDGVAPTLAHVADGTYHDWVENTFQYNKAHYAGLVADKKALVDTVIAKAALPEVMAALNNPSNPASGFIHAFGNGAYLAVPSLFPADANGKYVSTAPVNPYSRAVFGTPVDNCRVPTIWNNGVAVGGAQL